RIPDPSWILSVTTGLVVLVVYLGVAWSLSGRTYGCLVMGVRVVDGRGRTAGPWSSRLPPRTVRLPRALLRALAYAVLPIGLLWCAVDRNGRSLQDVLLRTSVIYDWQSRGPHRMPRRDAGGPAVS
ncbi:MAG: RDD family protein, partial [Nocardioidaceae bacterium]